MEATTVSDVLDGWLVRKDGYYVTAFLDSTLGWEDTIDIEDSPFISRLVKDLGLDKYYSVEEVVKVKALAFARNTLSGIGVNVKKHRVLLNHKKDASYTNGDYIVVGTAPMYDESIKEFAGKGFGTDVFIGLAIHEGCHIIFTDFKYYNEFVVSKDMFRGATELFTNLVNIIEDERIERRLLEIYPGNGNYLARVKEYYFNIKRPEEVSYELAEDESFEEFMQVLFQVIRYPKFLTDEHIERYRDILFTVKELLVPYPDECDEMLDKTYQAFELIVEYFGLKFEDPDDDTAMASAAEALGKISSTGSKTDATAKSGIADEDSKEFSKITGDSGKKSEEKILDGEVSMTKDGMKIVADSGSPAKYSEMLSPIKKYLAGFRHFLFYNTYIKRGSLNGLRSGNLDTSKLVDGVAGYEGIYYRKIKHEKKKLNVALLVDMSGSMGDGPSSCMARARECAILLTETFAGNKNADLYVYGYTGQHLTEEKAELYEFYTPKNPNKYSIVNMRAISQNLDGYSLLQTKDAIRKYTNEDVLLFMISDGEPAAHGYYGSSAISHLKDCVNRLERDKFSIVHIAVGYEGLSGVYKNVVTVKNVETLGPDLYKLVKKTLR